MSEEKLTLGDLLPEETAPKRQSLQEFLREQRIRMNRSPEDIKECEKWAKRGGYAGQFAETS